MHWRILDEGISAVAGSAWNRLSDEAYPYFNTFAKNQAAFA